MAKLWNVPCIFVCENNGYGMGTSVERASANTDYYTRGDYIPGIWVDGMDVLSVREATKFALEYATSGKGPLVMDCATYRYSGHSMSDPGTSYRSRDEINEVRQKRDPITSFKEKILTCGLVVDTDLKAIDAEVKKEVDEAHKRAKGDPGVKLDELAEDIYAKDDIFPLIRGRLPDAPMPHKRRGPAINMQ